MFFPIGDDNIKGGTYPLITYTLLVLNGLAFYWELQQGEAINAFIQEYGAIPVYILAGERLHTLFSSMFLHAGIAHILGNMLFLWIFADNIEAVIGNRRFLFFYLIGGLAAHAAHLFFNATSPIPTVGASGAIAAVMGAYLVMFPTSRVRVLFIVFPFYVSAYVFLGLWIFSQFQNGLGQLSVQTAQSAGVAYWAHIGGFVFGVAAGFFFRQTHPEWFDPRFLYRDRDLV